MKHRILQALLLLSFATNSQAYTAQEFLQRCDNLTTAQERETTQEIADRAMNFGACSGFVGGVISGVDLIGKLLEQKNLIPHGFICLPPNKPANTLLAEVLTYLRDNPEQQSSNAQLAVYNAVATAYPCES